MLFQSGRVVIHKNIYGHSARCCVSLWSSILVLTFYSQNVPITYLKLKESITETEEMSGLSKVRTEGQDVVNLGQSQMKIISIKIK